MNAVQLTVIGSGVSTGAANESSPGYLVTSGGAALLLECGPGIATRIQQYVALDALVGVVISHMHFDNFYDVLTLALVLYNVQSDRFASVDEHVAPPVLPVRLSVFLPPGGSEQIRHVIAAVCENSLVSLSLFNAMLNLHDYVPNTPFAVGPFAVTAVGPVAHEPGLCFGLRVSDTETTVGYSGETGWCDAVNDIARGVHLFLCDAVSITSHVYTRQKSRHLSADEAGHIAARMDAKHLILTHLADSSPRWERAMIHAARTYYRGPLDVARAGKVFTVSSASPLPPAANPGDGM